MTQTFSDIDYKKGKEKPVVEAMWQYILDHSDITQNGQLFVKFHITNKQDLYRAIHSRMMGIYRNDPYYKEALLQKVRKDVLDKVKMGKELAKLKNQIPVRGSITKKWWQKLFQ